MSYVLTTVAMSQDKGKAVKIELMFGDPPDNNQQAAARAEASALYKRHYTVWTDRFLQTLKDRRTGEVQPVYPFAT